MKRLLIVLILLIFTLTGCYIETPNNPLVTATPTPRGMVLPPDGTKQTGIVTPLPVRQSEVEGQYQNEALIHIADNEQMLQVMVDLPVDTYTRYVVTIDDETWTETNLPAVSIDIPSAHGNRLLESIALTVYQEEEIVYDIHLNNVMIMTFGEDDAQLPDISNADQVEYLWILGDGQLEHVDALSVMKQLKLLDLREVYFIRDISAIQNLSSLQHLYVHNSFMTSDDAAILRHLNLISLDAGMLDHNRNLDMIAHMTQLEYLAICFYTKAFGDALDQLNALRQVQIDGCTQFTEDDLRTILEKPALHTLEISRCAGLQTIPTGDYSENLARLQLIQCDDLVSGKGLEGLLSLKSLEMNSLPKLENVDFLSALVNLEELTLSQLNVENVDAVVSLRSLQRLEMINLPEVNDVSRLAQNHSIHKLHIALPRVDVAPMLHNPNLEYVYLEGAFDIQSLAPAENLKALTMMSSGFISIDPEVTILTDDVVDLSFLKDKASLEAVSIIGYPYQNIEALNTCTQMKKLWLNSSRDMDQMNHLRYLENMTQLEELVIDCIYVEDYDAVPQLTTLRELHLSRIQHDLPEGMVNLTALERLGLSDGVFESTRSLDFIVGLPHLEQLSIHNCRAVSGELDIQFLSEMSTLQSLTLECRNIHPVLPNLSGMTELHTLFLVDDHHMEDLSGLWELPHIQRLNLHGCDLGDLTLLSQMQSLRYLNIDGSTYDDIAPLQDMTWLDALSFG